MANLTYKQFIEELKKYDGKIEKNHQYKCFDVYLFNEDINEYVCMAYINYNRTGTLWIHDDYREDKLLVQLIRDMAHTPVELRGDKDEVSEEA